ncbi:MAG TPA: hypothetical protein VM369_08165, partial [Candidatus Binatia bacterium]|nr:hypothetical protein [Candidatus Binatia bacterium]
QGQVPLSEQALRLAGDAGAAGLDGYRRGIRRVGAYGILETQTGFERGGNYELAWLDDCAYVGTGDLARQTVNDVVLQGPGPDLPLPGAPLPGADASSLEWDEGYKCEGDPCNLPDPPADLPAVGLAILSVKNPAKPSLVYTLQLRITPRSPVIGGATPTPPSRVTTTSATANPWEALHANAERHLVLAGASNEVAVYQAVYSCKYPTRRAVAQLGSFMVRGLRIAADGNTAWLTDANVDGQVAAPVLAALDLSNVRAPAMLGPFVLPELAAAGAQAVELNADGTRAYVTWSTFPQPGAAGRELAGSTKGGVLVLDVSALQARAPGAQPKVLGRLEWDGAAHAVRRARVGGHDYLLVTDTMPFVMACPWGGARVIDLADETKPVQVAQIGLEVNDPANCMTTQPDQAIYSAHSVSVDDPDDTHLAFFGWSASGLRAFDLSVPAAPREVAYYNPAPNADTLYRSSETPTAGLTVDSTVSSVRFRPETGQFWFTSVAGGFQVMEFTRSMGPE